MPLEVLADAGVLPPEIVAHPERRDGVANGHVPPGQGSQQRLRQNRHEDVEPELEEAGEHHHQEQGVRGLFHFGRERRRDHAHHDEGGDVDHRVPDDPRILDHHLRRVVGVPEHRRAEHCRSEEGAAVHGVHQQEPQRHGSGADQPGHEPFPQNPRQPHAALRRSEVDLNIRPVPAGARLAAQTRDRSPRMSSRVYAFLLLAGALAFGGAGLVHPILLGDATGQLAVIAATPHWHAIHWTLLFALPALAVTPGPDAVFVYGMIHPAGLAAEREATVILGVAVYLIGRASLLAARPPRWLALGGVAAGTVAALGAAVTSEMGLTMYYCQGLLVTWMVVAGALGLVRRAS